MKHLISTITCLVFSSMVFANEISNKKNEISINQPSSSSLLCQTANARDTEGNVVASASCCRRMSGTESPTEIVTATLSLKICAEDRLKKVLEGND